MRRRFALLAGIEGEPRQMTIAHQEQDVDLAAVIVRAQAFSLSVDPARETVEHRSDRSVAERLGGIVDGGLAERDWCAVRLAVAIGRGGADVDHRAGRRFKAEALFGGFGKLLEVQRLHPSLLSADQIGRAIVADVQDRLRRNAQLIDHRGEQAFTLRLAKFGRAEDQIDQPAHVLTRRIGDQRAELPGVEIGVADDDHLQPARLGVAHERDDRREAEAMPRFRCQFLRDHRRTHARVRIGE